MIVPDGSPDPATAARLVPECHAALEACLELLRDAGERHEFVRNATDDLSGSRSLLKLVDGPAIPFCLREIRRVLGRFDAYGGHLVIDGDG